MAAGAGGDRCRIDGDTPKEDQLRGAEVVAVCVPDNVGRLVGKRVSADHWPAVLADGLSMPNFHLVTGIENVPQEGLDVTGVHTGYPNGRLRPVIDTLCRPGWEPTAAYVLCDTESAGGIPVEEAPRTILRRQVERLAAYDLSAMVASELEFFLFQTSYEAAHTSDYRELQPSYHRHGDNDILVSGFDEYLVGGIRRTMSAIGINLYVAQGEGAPGQHELNFSPTSPLQMADRHVLYKHGVKACAHQAGRSATFLAKPYTNWAGSSCHFHISLYDPAGEPTFGVDELHPLGASFLAGLLTYSPELMVCHAPYANSYRRIRPDTFAPSNLTWGWDNRTCMVRAVGRGQRCRLEFRTPGADVNPYLSLAAMLASGLAGVMERLEPPAPTTGDAYSDTHAPPLPRELGEAVRLFSESTLARKAFGDEVHRHLLGLAEHELDAGRRAVTDWDRRRGFEST